MNISRDEKIIKNLEKLSDAKYPLTDEEMELAKEIADSAGLPITNMSLFNSIISTISDERTLKYLLSLLE